MKKTLSLIFIAGLIFACGNNDVRSVTAKADQPLQEAASGEKIYKQYCVICHGVYGDMGVNGAANLSASPLSLEERILVITNGRNTMTPFSSLLSEEKIKAVAEYTEQLKTADSETADGGR